MRTFRPCVALAIILCALAAVVPAYAGTYKDRDGGTHKWSINDGHALVWDGAPYVPFGVVFEPRYLVSGQTDENRTADEQDVQAFKLAGINDIIIKPSKGLTLVPAAAVQKVIDLLEKSGLRYGLELHDPDYAPLVGYVIEPTANRTEAITVSGDTNYDLPDADSALFAFCDARTGEVRDYGRRPVSDGKFTTPVVVRSTGIQHVMLYYPRRVVSDTGLFDVWRGFDQHRDSLIVYLKQIKFGKGLRFFIDPFGDGFGIGGTESVIPVSTAFRFEYAAWLSKRYNSPGDLNIAWAVMKHDISSFDEAARLIPLWKDGRGAAAIYDDRMDKLYPMDASKSAIWTDLQDFRADSIRGYMDSMADIAKRVSADVPVIYSTTGLQPIYRTSGSVGYDGLVIPAVETGQALVVNAGRTLSLAESSSRTMWMLAHLKPSGGVYDKKQDLFAAVNTAHDFGAKGFFVDDTRGTGADGANLIAWLAEYASLSEQDKQFTSFVPRAIYYPEGTAGATVKRLSSGAWWLPTLMKSKDLYLGSSLSGYAVVDPKTYDTTISVWSLKGSQLLHLVSAANLTVTDVAGAATEVKPKKGRVEIKVGEEPVTIKGIAVEQFLPVEVVLEAALELEKAIARGEQKRMDTSDYKSKLRNARDMINSNHLTLALDLLHEATNEINQRLRGLEVVPQMGGTPGGQK